jgi:hypothetical protein
VEKVELKKADAPVAPPPEKTVIKVAGPGKIVIPNVQGGSIRVYEQQSGKSPGSIHSSDKFLQVPPGTYKLQFGELYWEGFEVAAGETKEIRVGTLRVPNVQGGSIRVYEQQSGKSPGSIHSSDKFLQVPPGTYKLQFGAVFIENIAVKAGQEVVLEQ